MKTLPGLPAPVDEGLAEVAPEVVRVDVEVVHLPHVKLGACVCGSVLASHDEKMVAMARRGLELPPIECDCGRVIVAQRKLVRVVKEVVQ